MNNRSQYHIDYRVLPLGTSCLGLEFGGGLFNIGESEGGTRGGTRGGTEGGIIGGSGRVEIDLERHATFMDLTVHIVGTVDVECDRCLDPYPQPVDYTGKLLVKISEQQGDYDGDIIWLHPTEPHLDLTDWLYESIVLSLPIQRVHPDQGHCNPAVVAHIAGTIEEIDQGG